MEASDNYAELLPEEPTLEDVGGEQSVLDDVIKARADAVKFLEFMHSDGWDAHTDENGVTLTTKAIEGSDLLMSKVVAEVNVSATDAMKSFRDFGKSESNRSFWAGVDS